MNTDKIGADSFSVIRTDTSFGHDASTDFSLPDYMPEIKRLLFVSSSVLPEGKFLNGGLLELDGTLAYNALYVGDDGSLTSAPLVTEYNADTALTPPPDNVAGIFVDTDLESTTCRATGPRSINIKSRIRFKVTCEDIFERDDAVIDPDGRATTDSESGVERLTEEVRALIRRRGSVTSNVTGEMTAPSGAKPVACDGSLTVLSAAAEGADVKVSGKIFLKCVFALPGGEYYVSKTDIPFDASVGVDGELAFTGARAWGRVASVSVSPVEGNDAAFSVSAEYDLDAEAYCEVTSDLCVDAYSTEYESENEFRDCEIPGLVCAGMKTADVRGEAELRNQTDDATLLDVASSSCQTSVSVSDGKIIASGTVKIRALLNGDGEIFSQEMEIPFKEELSDAPAGVVTQDLYSRTVCSAGDVSAAISGGKLMIVCPITLCYSVCRKIHEKAVSAVKLSEAVSAGDAPCIKVYYPDKDEPVWSICRKYKADRLKLLANNDFDGDIATKGKPVIII